MKKVLYPEIGLYKSVKENLDGCKVALKAAINVEYSIPNGCPGDKFLKNLPETLEKYYKELNDIIDKIKITTVKYE